MNTKVLLFSCILLIPVSAIPLENPVIKCQALYNHFALLKRSISSLLLKMRERDNIPDFYRGSTRACTSWWNQMQRSGKMNLDVLSYAIRGTENFMHYLLQEEVMKLRRGEVIREFSMFITKYILTSIANVKLLLEEYSGIGISNSLTRYKSFGPYGRNKAKCIIPNLFTTEKEISTIQIWLKQCSNKTV